MIVTEGHRGQVDKPVKVGEGGRRDRALFRPVGPIEESRVFTPHWVKGQL
jgi:hypothetical protein